MPSATYTPVSRPSPRLDKALAAMRTFHAVYIDVYIFEDQIGA
jgi:hypothetical protein